MPDVTICTVLRSGGRYGPEHVERMRDMMARHCPVPHDFVCFSDVPVPCVRIPLLHDWLGWWAKIELFRPDTGIEKAFYIDLDMTVQGDISDMVTYPHRFTALDNMTPNIGGIGSALMAWDVSQAPVHALYKSFARAPQYHMANNQRRHHPHWGDQGFIYQKLPDIDRFQQLFPGRVTSFNRPQASSAADIVVYFGQKKPWSASA